ADHPQLSRDTAQRRLRRSRARRRSASVGAERGHGQFHLPLGDDLAGPCLWRGAARARQVVRRSQPRSARVPLESAARGGGPRARCTLSPEARYLSGARRRLRQAGRHRSLLRRAWTRAGGPFHRCLTKGSGLCTHSNREEIVMQLTSQQLRQFAEEGYLFLPDCFSEEEVAILRDEAEQIYATNRQEVWREKTGAPRTAFAAHTYNEAFRLLGHHPRLVRPVEQVFGEQLYMHQYKINAKAAFEGDVWQWHQDYGTWARDDGMPEPRAM